MAVPVTGTLFFKVGGVRYAAKGNFTYNLGSDKQEGSKGADSEASIKIVPQLAYIEGEITDRPDLDLKAFTQIRDETVTLELRNGKTISLAEAWYAADGDAQTEEGNIQCRFEAESGEEIR